MKHRKTDPDGWEPRRRARRRALQALYQWQLTGQEASRIVDQFLEEQDFGNVDNDLFRSLVVGVTTEHDDLVARLQPLMDRPFEACDVMERIILLLGAWQLMHDHNTPKPVLLDECVDLAKRFGSEQCPVFVNGVLDKASSEWANSTSSV